MSVLVNLMIFLVGFGNLNDATDDDVSGGPLKTLKENWKMGGVCGGLVVVFEEIIGVPKVMLVSSIGNCWLSIVLTRHLKRFPSIILPRQGPS
ncbi:unnamed protein product [Ilex paraguariensis]|uniref:Uncharacterized protein n=1 Tax=Ilex paraguariensis TaxID=185542 RepID=A0ABC8RQV8_9AQUA